MQIIEPLVTGKYYHIYNRGINSCNLFIEKENYPYFMKLYERYIEPVAETFAWVLMPNHFHLLVRLKEGVELDVLHHPNPDRVYLHPSGLEDLTGVKPPHQHFSNLFNSYTKSINKRYNRHGALFERPFRRKLVTSDEYLKQLILYIHNNPVHHKFCNHPAEYPWSSYLTCISLKPTKLNRKAVIGWFDNEANFKYMHCQKSDPEAIEKWLEL